MAVLNQSAQKPSPELTHSAEVHNGSRQSELPDWKNPSLTMQRYANDMRWGQAQVAERRCGGRFAMPDSPIRSLSQDTKLQSAEFAVHGKQGSEIICLPEGLLSNFAI